MGSEQHYSLRWNDYTVKIVTAFQSLRDEEDFVDVTVACDGHSYSAHKMVLSACSPYFRALLRANPCQHPIVILKDVGHVELERLLEFMYNGEVSIAQDQLAAFLKTAENLKIRGLAGSSDDLDQAGIHRPDVSYSYSGGGATSGRSSPSAGYAPSQGSKDDDIAGEGGGGGGGGVSGGGGGGGGGSSSYHTRPDSPPAKRRKRSSAPASSHTDPNTTTHTSEGVGEALVEGIEGGGSLSSAGLPGDDELRLDRREMKSEPAMAGPSGSVGSQDGVGTHEPGVARGRRKVGHQGMQPRLHQQPPRMQARLQAGMQATIQPGLIAGLQIRMPSTLQAGAQNRPPRDRTSGGLVRAPTVEIGIQDRLSTVNPGLQDRIPVMQVEVQDRTQLALQAGSEPSVQQIATTQARSQPGTLQTCLECGKTFRCRDSLRRHHKLHRGTALACPGCSSLFVQRADLTRHVRRRHPQLAPIQSQPPPLRKL